MSAGEKHRVLVTLVAETQVEIDVDAQDGDDPTDLTSADYKRARAMADNNCLADWEVRDVRLAPPAE